MRYLMAMILAGTFLSGCTVCNTTTGCPLPEKSNDKKAATNDQNGRTVININAAAENTPTAPLMMQTGYQTVYTTEYGPMGPMVKKALIPVYSTAPMPTAATLLPAPSPTGVPCAPIVMSSKGNNTLIMSPNFPPAQPVNPAIAEPVAWFGPSSSPNNYASVQTNWF